jgi:hypothetical protein
VKRVDLGLVKMVITLPLLAVFYEEDTVDEVGAEKNKQYRLSTIKINNTIDNRLIY